MSMNKMLDEEITSRLVGLKAIEDVSDEYEAKTNILVKLMDRSIELKKIDAAAEEQNRRREDEKKDRLIRNVMTGVKDAAIIGVTIWGTVASINFEREGTLTTSAGRKHLNKILSWFK